MKFITSAVKSCAARTGTLTEFERIPTICFETPLSLIYTKGGLVPHLTKDAFERVTKEPQFLSVSLPSTMLMYTAMKDIGVNFANFVSMQEHINFLLVTDPAYLTRSGFQKLDTIAVWTKTGRHTMSSKDYMDIVETFKPDCYVALCDGDTNINTSKKRVMKAVNRSNILFEQCLARHSTSDNLKSTGLLAAIEGGYNMDARLESINYLKDKPVVGYVIDGLHNNGPDVQNISPQQVEGIIKQTISLLPAEKLKVSMGCWNPLTVLNLIELGVDIFDTSYPYVAAMNAEALTFLCDHSTCNNKSYVILFKEKRYIEDFSPICSHCECLTCKNHTRAYIHHLQNTREMLFEILLMIHNIHQYLEFFKAIRENIKNGTFDQYKQKIGLKFENTRITESNGTDKIDVKEVNTIHA
ncbi:queuine tRNA-ribosyltransferase accessory subunit 2 [Nomia melanderi]|uniref:queuine tRNA-ribosyltransferase accessory subunit 2 n=1 Tax=Nomia melanderi TaxID=2448451 RepID=UPI001304005C|nr:queuine tRNA-ribosyltransferase accessory subunit 2 [Nomia melanderi]